MKKNHIIIVFCLCNIYCVAQTSYLDGIFPDVRINTTYSDFHEDIIRHCQYLGEYYIADFEESPPYDERAETYLVDDIWNHGQAHIYVKSEDGRVKLIYVEFPWQDSSKLGSNTVATYTWAVGYIFPLPEYCGFGSPSDKGNEWYKSHYSTRRKLYQSWARNKYRVTVTLYYKWPHDPYREEHFTLEGSVARTEILYEVY